MFEKEVVIDGKGHLQGRLASYIAKELQLGQRIVVVRCELINKSGNAYSLNIEPRISLQEQSHLPGISQQKIIIQPQKGLEAFQIPITHFLENRQRNARLQNQERSRGLMFLSS